MKCPNCEAVDSLAGYARTYYNSDGSWNYGDHCHEVECLECQATFQMEAVINVERTA